MPSNKRASPRPRNAPIILRIKPGVGLYLREAYRAFSRDFHARLARHNITHAQWVLLWFLSQSGSLTPIMLSRHAGIKKASATAVIDQLTRRKLIRGVRDQHDGRKMNLSLTPMGGKLVKELAACAAATNAVARAGLSGKEIATLKRLLAEVTSNLEKSSW